MKTTTGDKRGGGVAGNGAGGPGGGGDEAMDVVDSPPSQNGVGEAAVEPSVPDLAPAHAAFLNAGLAAHAQGWAAIHFEAQAEHLAGLRQPEWTGLGQLLVDLKCARSLVRTAEIRSTLLEQR